MVNVFTFVLASLLSGGCESKAPLLKPPSTSQTDVENARDLKLAESDATEPRTSLLVNVTISKTQLRVGDQVVLELADAYDPQFHRIRAQYKLGGHVNSLALLPLMKVLQPLRDERRRQRELISTAAIVVDGATPFLLFAEVMYTLELAEFGAFELVVSNRHESRVIRVTVPSQEDVKASNVDVIAVNGGFIVSAFGSRFGSGCRERGPGITVPQSNGTYDFSALRECAAKTRQRFPNVGEGPVTLTANPDVPFQVIVSAMDALRSRDDGAALFPRARFTILR